MPIMAQKLTGVIVDDDDGECIPYASAVYRGNHVMVSSNGEGQFSIDRHNGWKLTFSAVGYQPLTVEISANTKSPMRISLKPEKTQLQNVTVRGRRNRYSRKDNPAVELMRRVIAAKKKTDLSNHDYYQYNKYQKLTLAFNDLSPQDLENGIFGKKQWALDQMELCPYNNKLILPVSVDETVTRKIYRKDPKSEKDIIMGQNTSGLNDLFETGDILNTVLKDVFTDVDLYDNQMRLLQYPFTSPIADNAISFYRYYIEDTTFVDRDKCYHLQFMPNNQQDFGFRGDLYVIADSTLHVRKCTLTIPKKSDVNFVDNLQIMQEYRQLDNGEWVLSTDDMFVEMSVAKFLSKVIVIRTTRTQDYDFDEINKKLFKGKQKERHEANAQMRDDDFWNQYRSVQLTKGESSMDSFIANIENIKGFKFIIFGLKALIENFVDTGTKEHPSKVDIGPVNTMITKNFIDGLRTRVSAQTTANLNPHWFANGYYAHGWDSKKDYYKAELIYSFNKKDYLPREFPKRTVTFTSTYDVASPSDKFVHTDKDNVFTAFKWAKVDKMMFYNRQQVAFEWEEEFGFKTTVSLKTEENEACGGLFFTPMDQWQSTETSEMLLGAPLSLHNGKIRTTELMALVRFAPGETFINTKQRRLTINLDAPVFTLGHTFGLKGFLGGDYSYNLTEATMYKRFWLPHNWGKIDCYVKGGIQWNKVPFPLLIMPAANLSYIVEDETFNLINNMEFLNDRYVSADMSWDMNGKVFNRIPLLKKLKWREYFGVKMLWGELTDKNNPMLEENLQDKTLMMFPEGSFVMDSHQPYFELIAGVHNIFKILHVEYVRRLNYTDLPTAHKNGIRLMMRMTF
ncbi:MAG: carboxypeptidase-like regulatory domain-containing protein [Prevotella sp.]|nr:carboxypeptidase-like regulatory domain-containing protein [Prevotella sp.]